MTSLNVLPQFDSVRCPGVSEIMRRLFRAMINGKTVRENCWILQLVQQPRARPKYVRDLVRGWAYNTIQYKFINMAAISWIKRKTITHKQRHAFKITLLEVDQRKRYKRVLSFKYGHRHFGHSSPIFIRDVWKITKFGHQFFIPVNFDALCFLTQQ